jgi:1-acyl-sn-glycerol-3-phosphate acyltransferase
MNPSTASPIIERPLYRGGRVIVRIVTSVLFDLKVRGVENVPKTGGVLIVSNHQSYLDPACIAVRVPRPFSFLAKSELFEVPGLAWLIRELGAIPIRQGAGDIGALRETIQKLRDGHALIVFPEGTRTLDGELQPLEPGIALIARKCGVPVVPVAIEGSFDAWPSGQPLPQSHPIRVLFGQPMINVQNMKPADLLLEIGRTLHDLIAQLRAGS